MTLGSAYDGEETLIRQNFLTTEVNELFTYKKLIIKSTSELGEGQTSKHLKCPHNRKSKKKAIKQELRQSIKYSITGILVRLLNNFFTKL